ncbi:MAG: signal peptidase I [Tissierellia bacterium]|nr:signal peptidase I [Tissierellia bacterium]
MNEDRDINEIIDKKTDKKTGKSIVIEWVRSILIAILIAFAVKSLIFEPTKIVGSSMETTLHNGDRVIVNKIVLKLRELKRGDIVVIKFDSNNDYIKRLVGLPGEYIQLIDGKIYINGKVYNEDYINSDYTHSVNGSEWKLGEDEYFVMGDNRLPGKSRDSRDFGAVNLSRIKGVANFRFYPFGEAFGWIE